MKIKNLSTIAAVILWGFGFHLANAQTISLDSALQRMSQWDLKASVKVLASDQARGRLTGSTQMNDVRNFIIESFWSSGLQPLGQTFTQPFYVRMQGGGSAIGANVVGYIPAYEAVIDSAGVETAHDYVVVGAHYDHLGTIGGRIFAGADNNASGVAALLEVAKAMGLMAKGGAKFKYNVLFVAFDAKEQGMAGSSWFIKKTLAPQRIRFMFNIDQVGTTLAPPGKSEEYLLILGSETFDKWGRTGGGKGSGKGDNGGDSGGKESNGKENNGGESSGKESNGEEGNGKESSQWFKELIHSSNRQEGLNLDIDYSFYGSSEFYDFFEGLSDQKNFHAAEVPAVQFTSGIHEHTLKSTDREDVIRYYVLFKRVQLIFGALYKACCEE